ncbi:hypothetical protein KC19_12G031200 [Ceratodon purpureus]|uniref:Uncharacterized protein n=1 Tax=Ceratodon purpureus TaxID=3225 RepID=A0A8T0G5I5_CERPU|nr:hypothetical protein KC19_12G031200 [Ceratodon purpureus]
MLLKHYGNSMSHLLFFVWHAASSRHLEVPGRLNAFSIFYSGSRSWPRSFVSDRICMVLGRSLIPEQFWSYGLCMFVARVSYHGPSPLFLENSSLDNI